MAIKFLNTVAVDTNVLYVNAATNKVGIGTTSPNQPLHVAGRAIIEDRLAIGGDFTPQKALHLKNAAPVFRFEDSDITGGYLDMIKTSRNMRFDLEQNDATSATNFNFRIGGTSQLYMRDQKVGIGTTNPEAKLHVVGGSQVTGATGNGTLVVEDQVTTIQILSASTRTGFINFGDVENSATGQISYDHLNDEMSFSTNNASVMSIDSAANVRIGGTSANAKLDVDGGVKVANDTDTAVAAKAGTLRYRYLPDTPKSQSKVDMCMQTGLNTYAWVNIVTNTWNN